MKALTDTYTLRNGVKIPCVGFGTWQTPDGDTCVEAVRDALVLGYRHIDTAAAYGNEASVGQAIRESGIPREELFITTKLANRVRGYKETLAAFEDSMKRLRLESHRTYCAARASTFREIFPAGEPIAVPPPRVIGHGNHRTLTNTSRSCFVACIDDAVVRGRSAIIEVGDVALADFQGDELARIDDEMEMDGEHSDTLAPYIADMAAARDIVRYWERTAPYRDADTERLVEAAADVADVLPDGWSVAVVFEDNSVEIHEVPGWPQTDESFRAAVCPLRDGRWGARFVDDEGPDTDHDTALEATRAALAALGVDTPRDATGAET